MSNHSSLINAAPTCQGGASLVKSLKVVAETVSREFGFTTGPCIKGVNCITIREEWDGWIKDCLANQVYWSRVRHAPSRKRKFVSLSKGVKRVFDATCKQCDKKASREAINKWTKKMAEDCRDGETHCSRYLDQLRRRVRELSVGWGKHLQAARGIKDELVNEYTPDRQGCLEKTMLNGGTLSVPKDYRTDDYSLVRLGCAKTKGKHRVVTMQSAFVKRTLTPVHRALYNHLSDFDWLVRGDVTTGDFEAILRDAEKYKEPIISGDYDSATDNIYQNAVQCIVEELSKDSDLTEEERTVFMGSFVNLRYIDTKTMEVFPIKRGSMMGNLCSFPVLCLLNKACFDIATDEVYGSGNKRKGRFNGDDCIFAGSTRMYQCWREVTSRYGLVVNESKTDVSRRFIDLNSQCYDIVRRRMIGKPVLSFLGPINDSVGEQLTSILEGISSLKWDVQQWLVNVHARYLVSLKGVSLSGIPQVWVKQLVKRKWFRNAVVLGGAAKVVRPYVQYSWVKKEGKKRVRECTAVLRTETRELDMVMGPVPKPEYLSRIDELCSSIQNLHTDFWCGKNVIAAVPTLDRKTFRQEYDRRRKADFPPTRRWFLGFRDRFVYRYPSVLYREIEDMDIFWSQTGKETTYPGYSSNIKLQRCILYRPNRYEIRPPTLHSNSPRYSPFSQGLNQVSFWDCPVKRERHDVIDKGA
ncbi:RNA-dependent RNA polymerase [Botrytis cinerea botoulivirus 19]|uniref:RNA-dependent RNA polymerase n=1 Tax=Botrytis cinerea botoulivirus 19 TaxID=2912895 RepID=UPI002481D8F6|nr:RNA-dependent RNA polymerase [Botrytis cinerea botoulivirus 19]UJT32091.1 RNA-dependent RNA polymerase [Botrytis cinerea botoulivirus 19]